MRELSLKQIAKKNFQIRPIITRAFGIF